MNVKEALTKVKEMLQDVTGTTVLELDKVELAQMKLEDGVTVIEAESFEAGQNVFVVTEEASVPLPVGDYALQDGQVLVVAEEGVIAEIKAMEEETEEVEQAGEFVTIEVFNAFVEEVKNMITGLGKDPTRTTTTKVIETLEKEVSELSEEKTELEKETVELQEKLDVKPDAEKIKTAPIEKKVVLAKSSRGRILQNLQNTLN